MNIGGDATRLPRIALVTPAFNSVRYIEATIQSVLAQNYPNLDYFIVDGGSTDGTIDIIKKYEHRISGWLSEPDNNPYEALNKGFDRTTGEIMGWITSTDMLHVGGLAVVGSVFAALGSVDWITGWPTTFTDDGMAVAVKEMPRWSRTRFLAGVNRFIQQESTYWRRSLWIALVGGSIPNIVRQGISTCGFDFSGTLDCTVSMLLSEGTAGPEFAEPGKS